MIPSIRYFTQLFASYVVVLLVALIAGAFFMGAFFKQYVENNTIEQLKSQIEYLHTLPVSKANQAITLFNQSSTKYPVRLTVIQPDGRVIFDSINKGQQMDNHINRPEVMTAKAQGMGHAIRFSQTLNKDLVYVAKAKSNGPIYRLAIPLNNIENEYQQWFQSVVTYMVIIFGVCLLVTFYMSRWISSPLHWSAQTLKRINNYQFDQVVPKKSMVKEINDLNHQLIDVSQNISQYIQKVSKEKQKKDMILNNMINGLVVVDQDLNVQLMNKAAFQLCFNIFEDTHIQLTDYPVIHDYLHRVMQGTEVDPIEIEHADTGKQVLLLGSKYQESHALRGILIAQDITRLKRLESTRQQFVANVSHELKTPITLIRSMVETIITSKNKGIDIPETLLKNTLNHTDRLNHIIDDLLHLSQLETTGGQIDKQLTTLGNLIDVVDQQCRPKADTKQIQINWQILPQLTVYCNPNLMVQAIKNLVDNAIKYSPSNTQITIQYQSLPASDQLLVIDQGPGIPQEHLGQLFRRFYRIDAARSRQMGGTGLGLAIVKHIAQSHGGRAMVQNNPDKGTTFIIEIPKEEATA